MFFSRNLLRIQLNPTRFFQVGRRQVGQDLSEKSEKYKIYTIKSINCEKKRCEDIKVCEPTIRQTLPMKLMETEKVVQKSQLREALEKFQVQWTKSQTKVLEKPKENLTAVQKKFQDQLVKNQPKILEKSNIAYKKFLVNVVEWKQLIKEISQKVKCYSVLTANFARDAITTCYFYYQLLITSKEYKMAKQFLIKFSIAACKFAESQLKLLIIWAKKKIAVEKEKLLMAICRRICKDQGNKKLK